HLPLPILARVTFRIQTEADVFFDCEPRKELAFLGNVTHFGIEPAHFFALIKNPPRRWRRKSRDEPEQRRLATTAGSDNRHELPGYDVQRDILERADDAFGGSAEKFGNALDLDDWLATRLVFNTRLNRCFSHGFRS